jgi:hypothetical protein
MDTKYIKIPYNGPIYAKGGIYGPITTPYVEEVSTIFRMISDKVKVVEVLSDGKEIELNATNFNKNNEPVVKENKPVEVPVSLAPAPAPIVAPQNFTATIPVNKNQGNKNQNATQQTTNKAVVAEKKIEEKIVTPDIIETK